MNTGNHMIDEDDGRHPSSPRYRAPFESKHDEEEVFLRIVDDDDDGEKKYLDEFTNEELMEELMSRFNGKGFLSIVDEEKIKYLFKHIDSINMGWMRSETKNFRWLTK